MEAFRKLAKTLSPTSRGITGRRAIDAVVSTHPDQDHVNGLHVVLDQLTVKELWIHKPWEHNQELAKKFSGWPCNGREHRSALERESQQRGRSCR